MVTSRREMYSRHVAELMATMVNVAPFRQGRPVKAEDFLGKPVRRGSNVMQVPFSKFLDLIGPPKE